MDQALNSQKTPHTSPLRASYGMSFVSILMKNDRVIKGFYCTTAIFAKSMVSPKQFSQEKVIGIWFLHGKNRWSSSSVVGFFWGFPPLSTSIDAPWGHQVHSSLRKVWALASMEVRGAYAARPPRAVNIGEETLPLKIDPARKWDRCLIDVDPRVFAVRG